MIIGAGYGRRVGLEVHPDDVDVVRAWLPFWWQEDAGNAEHTWQIHTRDTVDAVIRDLELWVAEHAVDRVFVHAGMVAVGGRALLLPGRSFSGKSALVTALVRAGAAYGSDEYAVLDADGLVHPYPRPIALRQPDGTRRYVRPEALGAEVVNGPIPVAAIAVLKYESEQPAKFTEMSEARSVLELLDNTVSARTSPAEALTACSAAAEGSRAISGIRSEAAGVADDLRDMLKVQD